MNKASKALRRSSIRLKSFTLGHPDLNMIVSDLKEVRSTAKAFMLAQQTAWRDMAKWAAKEQNTAIFSSFSHFIQLNDLWTEVQTEFLDNLNKFRYQFDMVLEGEQHLDKRREHLSTCEQRESKLRKELKKVNQKTDLDEIKDIEEKIVEAKSSVKAAQIEITERLTENEGVKVIRVKEGLTRLSDSFIDLANKSSIIFQAQKEIAVGLPERDQVEGRGIQEIQYKGSERAKRVIQTVEENLRRYKRQSPYRAAAPTCHDSPPPYTYSPSPTHQPFYQNTPSPGHPSYSQEPDDSASLPEGQPSYRPNPYSFPAYQCEPQMRYDLPPGE